MFWVVKRIPRWITFSKLECCLTVKSLKWWCFGWEGGIYHGIIFWPPPPPPPNKKKIKVYFYVKDFTFLLQLPSETEIVYHAWKLEAMYSMVCWLCVCVWGGGGVQYIMVYRYDPPPLLKYTLNIKYKTFGLLQPRWKFNCVSCSTAWSKVFSCVLDGGGGGGEGGVNM